MDPNQLRMICYWRDEYREALLAEEQAHTRQIMAHNRLMDLLTRLPEPKEGE